MSTYKKHMAAIMAGTVTKSNVIGIRKAINARWRIDRNYSGSMTAPVWSRPDLNALERTLEAKEPRVDRTLHENGLAILRSPRWRSRFNEKQAGIIERLDCFRLVRFDRIGHEGSHCVPVYRAQDVTGQSFLFRNIPWQSAVYGGMESGPTVVEEN